MRSKVHVTFIVETDDYGFNDELAEKIVDKVHEWLTTFPLGVKHPLTSYLRCEILEVQPTGKYEFKV